MPQKIHIVTLTFEERSSLQDLVAKGRTAAHKRLHAQILLKADAGPARPGWKDKQIVEAFDTSIRTVERVRKRFVEEGVEAAINRKKRAPTPLMIDGDIEAHLIATACGKPPEGRECWTMQLLADRLIELKFLDTVSDETVRRTLKKTRSSLG